MRTLGISFDDVVDYKKTSMLIAFPYCKLRKCKGCQNQKLWDAPESYFKDYNIDRIVEIYRTSCLHNAVVMAGLEPFDSEEDVLSLIKAFYSLDKPVDIIIYTGYTREEYNRNFKDKILDTLKNCDINKVNNKKLIIKVGRYIKDNKNSWFSDFLGVKLATDNQKVIRYSVHYNTFINHPKTMIIENIETVNGKTKGDLIIYE